MGNKSANIRENIKNDSNDMQRSDLLEILMTFEKFKGSFEKVNFKNFSQLIAFQAINE